MAWRPSAYLLEGQLENTTPGKVTGWMRFAGLKQVVRVDLEGDFHRDIRGAKIRLTGNASDDENAERYMQGFSPIQTGKAGDITAGLPPHDYLDYPYIEWYSQQNGRVVVELEPEQVEVIGTPLPANRCEPISRTEQDHNMANFLTGLAQGFNVATGRVRPADARPQRYPPQRGTARPKASGMKLMTQDTRKMLPPLGSQEGLGGKAIAQVKFFTPDSSWRWYATEHDGRDTFFGLVDGHCRELGYFSLSELETVRGPLGLPIERNLYWKRKPLEEIAPELFGPARPSE